MTTETTLMTEAATTNEGQTSSQAAPEVKPEGQTTDAQQQQPEQAEVSKEESKPAGAPEKYEFTAPEGKDFDAEVIGKFSEVAKELNLSQESAQKVIDKLAPALMEKQARVLAEAKAEWVNNAQTDKEYGGEKLNESLSVARKALEKFGTPELKALLNESGLGNHPEVIRMMYRAGKAISEDSFVPSGSGGKQQKTGFQDYAKSLYPNQQ